MAFGGGAPYPRKLGGGRPRARDLRDAIGQDRGDAYTNEPGTVVYAENAALGRAISSGWGTNIRLGNLWNPHRCDPQTLSRWETILAIPVDPKATVYDRRQKVAKVLTFTGEALRGNLLSALAELGSFFVALEYVDIGSALITSPDPSYPFGIQLPDMPWSSNVARIVLRMQCPPGRSEADFFRATAKALSLLDPYLPVWITCDWYRPGPTFAPSGGMSAAGFYLDTENNLDNQIFD